MRLGFQFNETSYIMSHHHVFHLRGDVTLCCVVLFTNLPVRLSVPRASHTDTYPTQFIASIKHSYPQATEGYQQSGHQVMKLQVLKISFFIGKTTCAMQSCIKIIAVVIYTYVCAFSLVKYLHLNATFKHKLIQIRFKNANIKLASF